MKRIFIFILGCLITTSLFSQENTDTVPQMTVPQIEQMYISKVDYSQNQQMNYLPPYTYIEFGLGGMIPTDNSNSYFCVNMELGKYITPIVGIGLEFKTGSEDRYHDHLSYIGLNTRYRLNYIYNPNRLFDFELMAGLGYGWYSYIDNIDYYDYDYYYDYYYESRVKFSYVVPKLGANVYINLTQNTQIGICPEFAWYISTNKDNSNDVGVINIFGKIKFNF